MSKAPRFSMGFEHSASKPTALRQDSPPPTQFFIRNSCIPLLTKYMRRHFQRYRGFVFCLVLLLFNVPLAQGITSRCESVTTEKGSTTNLTCTFGEDLSKVETIVYVDHVQRNTSKHALVASCQWTSNGYDCKTVPGYLLTGKVTNTLSVNIPNTNETNAGKYWCEIFGSDPSDRTTCEITVVEASSDTTVKTLSKSGTGGSDVDTEKQVGVLIALTTVFACLILVMFGFIVAVLVYLKRKWYFKGSQKGNAIIEDKKNKKSLI